MQEVIPQALLSNRRILTYKRGNFIYALVILLIVRAFYILRLGQMATTVMYPGYLQGIGSAMRENNDEDLASDLEMSKNLVREYIEIIEESKKKGEKQ